MEFEEMAWEFVGVFDDLTADQINEMLAKNVPFENLKFFSRYASEFGAKTGMQTADIGRLPNLMLIGYLIRVLEERLVIEKSNE
jgi:hypothetical protein